MKKIFAKDTLNRKLVNLTELKTFISKHISLNQNLPQTLRWRVLYNLSQSIKNNSKTHLSNRCIKTINRRTFFKFSKFSRVVFLRLAKAGLISGIRKSVW